MSQAYEAVIGLEVHLQLATRSKMFCSCETTFTTDPNVFICPVCLAEPGALPVINRHAVQQALLMGLAFRSELRLESVFERKSYFYPDLPKGYQITQYSHPIVKGGSLMIPSAAGTRSIRLHHAHLEEDAGKLLHEGAYSIADYNRAGTPLLEIVSEPDLRTSDEVCEYLRELRTLARYLGVSDANMEEGSLRCDANISVRPVGSDRFGTRVEIKNMNSISGLRKAVDYEIARQVDLVQSGSAVLQETRLFDVKQERSFPMRSKETVADYRYFPDPDLPILRVSAEDIDALRALCVEIPFEKRARFVQEYHISAQDALVLTEDLALANYFESVVQGFRGEARRVSNWILTELLSAMNHFHKSVADVAQSISPQALQDLLHLLLDGTVSGKMAKELFQEMLQTAESAQDIMKRKNLTQVSDNNALQSMVDQVLAANPKEVERFRAGEKKLMGFFMGELMKMSKGQANPGVLGPILERSLQESS